MTDVALAAPLRENTLLLLNVVLAMVTAAAKAAMAPPCGVSPIAKLVMKPELWKDTSEAPCGW